MKKYKYWSEVSFYINAYHGEIDGWRCKTCSQIVYTPEEEIRRYVYCPFCRQTVLEDNSENEE